MSEEHDEAQEQVRRLLAAAGSAPPDHPLPEDVAARLDDVLAGLVAERQAESPGRAAEVADLDSRRPRRWPQLLVAAAAVSVVGLGVGNLVQDSGGEAMSADSAAAGSSETAPRQSEGGEDGGSTTDRELAAEAAPEAEAERSLRTDADGVTARRPARLRSDSLALDVQRIEDFALAVPVGGPPRRWDGACVRPTAGEGDEWLPVRLEGKQAVLVLRAPAGGRRTAEVFACGEPDAPVARVTIDPR